MGLIHKLNNLFRPARLTRGRMIFAVLVAVVADGLQIMLQIVPTAPEIIDAVAMVLTSVAIGFHVLLLPTFAVEFVPVVDMLPTWTGCVLAVIALRRREQPPAPPVLPAPDGSNRDMRPSTSGSPTPPTKDGVPPRIG